jgi:AAA+ ATPase superfamily predicted ATPase
MGLVKVSEDVMVFDDPSGMQVLIIVTIALILILAVFRTLDDSVLFILLLLGAVILVIYSKTKLTLDKKAGKVIIERNNLIGSKTSTLPIKKIAKLKLAGMARRFSIDYYLDFLEKDGSSIAKEYINRDDAEQVASFLGVPLEKPKSWLKKIVE